MIYCILVGIKARPFGLSILTNTKKDLDKRKKWNKGYSTNKALLFKGGNHDYWKECMITHFESIHINLWDVVENGNYIPLDEQLNEVPRSTWTNTQK